MIPDLDIYRSANVLVTRHGEDAPIHAAMRADKLLEKGDLGGYAVWKRILRAVEELLSKGRPDGAGRCRTLRSPTGDNHEAGRSRISDSPRMGGLAG